MNMEWPRQLEVDDFYGNPRGAFGSHVNPEWVKQNITYITPPYPMKMGFIKIKKIPIHKLCADSLERVFESLLKAYQDDAGEGYYAAMAGDGVTEFDGSFVYRSKRGSSHLSNHAYAAAIDIDAANNQFRSSTHRFQNNSPIVKCFKAEGWSWGGDWRNPVDSMHFEAIAR